MPIILAVAIMPQAAIEEISPLRSEFQKLASSPVEVQYEFITSTNPRFGVPLRSYARLPQDVQTTAIRQAYFLAAIKRAMLVYQRDPDLAAILNSFTDGPDAERVATSFEQTYRAKFGRWPPIVPVNVSTLIARMLNERAVR